ncbi:hypothetical protein EJ110_NYTH18074 [Nymphaea thermarum]|nr:hypothetical protein EJ110_NYTH18074 [Nymphaea thermarum]
MATSSLGDGSLQQMNVGRRGDNERNKFNTKVMKGGKDSAQGAQEKGKMMNDEIAVNRLGERTSPVRFMFAARTEELSPDKETHNNINMKEGSEQGLTFERKQVEATDIKQKGMRKSARFASKGKKGRPPATVSSLEDVIVHRYNGTKKRKKETDNMNHALIELPYEENEGENVSGPEGVVRVLCVWKEEELEASSLVVDSNWVGMSFRRLQEVEDNTKRFTWSNHRQGQDSVQCKLDWCMINNEWQNVFCGEGKLMVQTSASSDHSVLLYQTKDTFDDSRGQKPFRIFKPWLLDRKGKEVINEAWRGEVQRCPMMCLLFKLNRLRMALANRGTINTIKIVLEDFERLAGMKVNKQKSEIFAKTMVDCQISEIQGILQWTNGNLPSEYLGFPLFLGSIIENLCLPLLTKVEKRLTAWKARLLSYAGRLCLIRYVLMTLSYYWMMGFRLPKVVIKTASLYQISVE